MLAADWVARFVKTLVIYLMAMPETPELAQVAVEAGADIVELGFPFSDPLADGPVIRRAGERALAAGMRIARCLECLAETRALVDVPLIPMTYASIFEAYGWERLERDARAAGATSLIVVDLPCRRETRAPPHPARRADLDRRADPAGRVDDRRLAVPRHGDRHDRRARRALPEPAPLVRADPRRHRRPALRRLRHLDARPRRRRRRARRRDRRRLARGRGRRGRARPRSARRSSASLARRHGARRDVGSAP